MKVFIPHFYYPDNVRNDAFTGATISLLNHIKALSMVCEVYLKSDEPTKYGESVFGIPTDFETIDSSIAWFESFGFDALILFDAEPDDLAFYRHVCPSPIIIRLSLSYGENRAFMNKALNCYSLLRPFDVLAPKSVWCGNEIGKYVYNHSCIKPISNGIDLELFRPQNKKEAKHKLAQQSGDQRLLHMPVVGFSNRLEPAKGINTFLRVADLNSDLLFVIIGQQFGSITHPENVLILGHQPYEEMASFYSAFDVLCAISIYGEACPSTILEGMACGVPIVASKYAGTEDLLEDCGSYINVQLFDHETFEMVGYIDPEEVSDKIRCLIENQSEQKRIIEKAKKRVATFSWENVAQAHIDLIKFLQERQRDYRPSLPLTVHFSQGCNPQGDSEIEARVFNYFAGQNGPFPRMPFTHQDVSMDEALCFFLSQYLHPNELEAALLGLVGDRVKCQNLLAKMNQLKELLTEP